MAVDYYASHLKLGEDYERFVIAQLAALGLDIQRRETRRGQYNYGDTTRGIEIKFDQRLASTGNLYIEVAEKRRPTDPEWRESGVMAPIFAPWYGIGDYSIWFLFKRARLRELRASYREITIARGTSRGFLLPARDAHAAAFRVRTWEPR